MIEIPEGVGHICQRCISRINGNRIDFYPEGFDRSTCEDFDRIVFNGKTPIFMKNETTDEFLKKELTCVLCFGILYCDHPQTDFNRAIRKAFVLGGYEGITGDHITMEVVLPVSIVFREFCFRGLVDFPSEMIELKDAYRALFIKCVRSLLLEENMTPTMNPYLPKLDSLLPLPPHGTNLQVRQFSIRIELCHPDTKQEVEAFRIFNRSNFIKTQQGKRRKTSFPPIAATTIQTALKNLSRIELERVVSGAACPLPEGCVLPEGASKLCLALQTPVSGGGECVSLSKCELKREYFHLTGHYIKTSRQVSQCPWKKRPDEEWAGLSAPPASEDAVKVDNNEENEGGGVKRAANDLLEGEKDEEEVIEGVYSANGGEFAPKPCTVFLQDESVRDPEQRWQWSVEGVLHKVLQRETGCERTNMVSSGREDVDVRMLGDGRGFALELLNCRRASNDENWIRHMEEEINKAGQGRVIVKGLKWAPQAAIKQVHMSAEVHRKVYRAMVWVKRGVTEEELKAKIDARKSTQIQQNTPIRVLHRRSALIRPRFIYWMQTEKINDNFFILTLETQAGTYIKEFVHGDLGRTKPSIRSILDSDADILQLDVMNLVE